MAAFLPTWHNFFMPGLEGDQEPASLAVAAERALYWGYIPWILCAAGVAAVLWQKSPRGKNQRFWAVACMALLVGLTCLSVNHFHSYKILFNVVPGFSALRVPGRLALLALWPCGLLAGWGLARAGEFVLPHAPYRRSILCLGIIALAFLENYHPLGAMKQSWTEDRVQDAAFYKEVIAKLPPGPFVTVPLAAADAGAGDPYLLIGAVAAGWRPTLNVYTSRVLPWLPTVINRAGNLGLPEQAASLAGEFRLRGIRYLVVDKRLGLGKDMKPDPIFYDAWSRPRTSEGRPWGQVVYEDDFKRVLDLQASPPEICLEPSWAHASPSPDEIIRDKPNGGVGDVPLHGSLTFEPTMPLQPGRYQVEFDLETDRSVKGSCVIRRIFFTADKDWQLDELRPPAVIVTAPLLSNSGNHSVHLEFTVPDEEGPEAVFEFRTIHDEGGALRVPRVRITPLRQEKD
jgi:hypothetical protein